MTISSYAQFITYEPVIVDHNGNRVDINSSTSNNYNYYNPNINDTPQGFQQAPSQVSSIRGYYIKNNQWNSVLIRVKIVGENISVVGVKRSIGWDNRNFYIYKVSPTMSQEIKDNFEYYINAYDFGNIYF